MGVKLKKKVVKKGELSQYSAMLDLPIDHFTGKIRDEINDRLDIRVAIERNDKTSIVRALSEFQGVAAHLITEYRRVKSRWNATRQEFDKLESQAIYIAREELPSKSTEKQIRQLAYEKEGEELYNYRSVTEDLEQRMKTLSNHIDVTKLTLSGIQTALNVMRVEWESPNVER